MDSGRALSCRMSPEYLRTVPGLLKLVELVLSIIAFACAAAVADQTCSRGDFWYWGECNDKRMNAFGWVSFVGISGFILALICLLVHFTMSTRWAWPRFLELGLYALWTICFAIAGIVAAALHGGHGEPKVDRTAAAAAAFSFFSMAAWAADTVLQAMNTRVSVTTHTVTTTTTTSNVNTDVPQRFEGNPQY